MNQNINVKIMKKPELTDEEIRSHMQFDELLDACKIRGPVSVSAKWFYTAGYVASIVLVISTALYFFLPKPNKVKENNNQPLRVYPLDSAGRVKSQIIQGIPKVNAQEKKINAAQSTVSSKKKEQNSALPPNENNKVLSQFTEAEPVDGYPALYEYFDHELKYPVNVVRDSVEGVVTVSFAINQDGKPGLIKIENSLGTMFDKECERVIESMPSWKPATINGKPISTRLSIPLTFKIKK
jgi:TonB family protein